MQPRARPGPLFCNAPERARRWFARKVGSAERGTFDAFGGGMKDVVFIAVTIAFFAVAWLYAKSFDHL
jgi:hypothetical protein